MTNTKTTNELTVHLAISRPGIGVHPIEGPRTHLSANGGKSSVCHGDEGKQLHGEVLEGAPNCIRCRQVYDR